MTSASARTWRPSSRATLNPGTGLCLERTGREVAESGRPIAHVARDLGIHPEALRNWMRQGEADRGERTDRATTSEKDELARLRREVAELRRANEILKAASVYFAKELDRPRTK